MPSEPLCFYVATVRSRRQRRPPPVIGDPESVYRLVHPLVSDLDREHVYALYLSTRHTVIRLELVSVGSLAASVLHPREVFKAAIGLSAASIIVCHNHPSGDPEPSEDDLAITKQLARAGEVLGIPVVDHVIVGKAGAYVSLRERHRL